ARIVIAEAQILVLDLPAALGLLERGDLGEAAKFDRWIAAGVKEFVDNAFVERVARTGKAPEEASALTLAVGLLIQRGLLRVGVFDDGEVPRVPFLDSRVFAIEDGRRGKLLAGLFEVPRFAQVGEGLSIV